MTDESAKLLLRELRESFTIEDDLNSLDKCTLLLNEFDETTAKVLREQRMRITDYEKEVQRLNEHIRELNGPKSSKQTNDKEIKREINKLEDSVFSVAKEIGLIEFELNRIGIKLSSDLRRIGELEFEIAKMRNKFDENARNRNKNGEIADDPETLETDDIKENILLIKIKLFEQIGLKIDSDLSKLVILNKTNNSMNTFDLKNDNQYSDYFISNFIWDNI